MKKEYKTQEEVDKKIKSAGKPRIINGVSCKNRYAYTSALVGGYSQLNPTPRALGFKHSTDIQQSLQGYNHLINAGHVETVVKWLFNNGYDVVKLNED